MPEDSLTAPRSAHTRLLHALALVGLGCFATTDDASAQRFTAVPPDPDQPVAEGFDVDRAIFWAEPNFVPLHDPEWKPLRAAIAARELSDETPVLVFEVADRTLALVSSQMSYHHVAQGEMAGEPWMVTF